MKKAILFLGVLFGGYFAYASCPGNMNDPSSRKRCLYNYASDYIEALEKQLASEYKKTLTDEKKMAILHIRNLSSTLEKLNVYYELLNHVNPRVEHVLITNKAPILTKTQ